jgi:hypothetical protein
LRAQASRFSELNRVRRVQQLCYFGLLFLSRVKSEPSAARNAVILVSAGQKRLEGCDNRGVELSFYSLR